jgi:tetratricopeptide (TPR) repeat protein
VYEERQANPAWGERLNPRYREMILAGESPPASRLSQAFLAPPSALDLQFAYYQSSLVVEFLVERFGLDRLKAILGELGRGAEINQALAQHTAPLATLDKDFAAFARQKAEQLAPGLDWTKPNLPAVLPNSADALNLWAAVHPTNYWALSHRVQDALESKQWQEAKAPLRKLIELYPASVGTDNPYRSLASVHRTLRETNEEFLVLTRWVELDGEAPDAYLRLMELAALAKNWPVASNNARRFLAVNPLVPAPYRYLAQASEAMGKTTPAVNAYRALLELDPENPAEIHFRLAQLLDRAGDPGARRHLLQALEEAPRHPAGLRLLLKLNGESVRPAAPAATDGKGGA